MFKKARYVYAVFRAGSFTRAAEQLFISQPCLSAAIKQLEGELGAPLFVRKSGSVVPTELGLSYIRTAEQIIALEDAFAAQLGERDKTLYGSLCIGGSNYVSSYILPRIVSAFSLLYPHVTISLTEASSAELTKHMQDGELDLVIDSFDREMTGITYHPLLQEQILLAVPSSANANKKNATFSLSPRDVYEKAPLPEPVSITCFREESFVLLKEGNSMYEHAMTIFRKSGFTPKVSLFLDQLSTSFALAAQGNGLCFVTDTVFRYHKFDDPVRLYRIKEGGTRMLCLAHKKGEAALPLVQKFIGLADELI